MSASEKKDKKGKSSAGAILVAFIFGMMILIMSMVMFALFHWSFTNCIKMAETKEQVAVCVAKKEALETQDDKVEEEKICSCPSDQEEKEIPVKKSKKSVSQEETGLNPYDL